MSRLKYLRILMLLIVVASCQKLQPESVVIPEYPDFEQLMKQQVELLGKSTVQKAVQLEGQIEEQVIEMDSSLWAEELSFLKEVNPNQPEYVGALVKSSEGETLVLTLGPEETGPLKKVKYKKKDKAYQFIHITFHEDKDVYIHHRDIEMRFDRGVLNTLEIDGYQKMMFKDTVRFGIEVTTDSDR